MNKAFSTLACMDADAQEVIRLCRQHSIRGAELRMGADGSICGVKDAAGLRQMGRAFAEAGIAIPALGTSECPADDSEQAVAGISHAIDCAAAVGAGAIRLFLGNFPDAPDPKPVVWDGIVRLLRNMCGIAEREGVAVWIETHNEFSTGEVLAKLAADVGCWNLRFIWDVMHPIEAGETKLEDTWAAIGPLVAHAHIKDGVPGAGYNYRYTLLGEGSLPLADFLGLLERESFDGFVSLEWERAWREELAGYPASADWILNHFNQFLQSVGAE